MVQLLHPYMTPGKAIALTIPTFVGKVMSLLFNMMSRFVNSYPLSIQWNPSPLAISTFLFKNRLFIFGRTGSWLPRGLFSSCRDWGLLSSCGAWASHGGGSPYSGAPALAAQASIVVVRGHDCPAAGGIFLDQGSKPVPCLGRWSPHHQLIRKSSLHSVFLS